MRLTMLAIAEALQHFSSLNLLVEATNFISHSKKFVHQRFSTPSATNYSDATQLPKKGVDYETSDPMAADIGLFLWLGTGVASSPRGDVTRLLC
jgi:hypothetical protein